MPWARTWTEEIVAEWLQLCGYVIEIGLPAGVAKQGGRFVADVVGARIADGVLEIKHIEVGTLPGGRSSVKSISKKFSPTICASIESHFRQILGFVKGATKYEKVYVASYWTQPTIEGAKRLGVEIHTLPDFLRDFVLPTISRWKKNPPHQSQARGTMITLPESHWLLQLIDYLQNYELLK